MANGLITPGLGHYCMSSTCWPTNNNTRAPNTECDLGRFHHDWRSSLPIASNNKTNHTAPAEAKHTHTKTQGARDDKQHKREEAYLRLDKDNSRGENCSLLCMAAAAASAAMGINRCFCFFWFPLYIFLQ